MLAEDPSAVMPHHLQVSRSMPLEAARREAVHRLVFAGSARVLRGFCAGSNQSAILDPKGRIRRIRRIRRIFPFVLTRARI